MEEDFVKVPVKVLAGWVAKKPADFVANLKGDEEQMPDDAWKKADKDLAERFEKTKTEKEAQYKRGLREKGESLEGVIEPLLKKHGLELSDTVEESVATLLNEVQKAAKPGKTGDSTELTKEVILQSPVYQELLTGIKQKHSEEFTSLKSEYEQYKDGVQSKERNATVFSLVRNHLTEMNANEPTDDNINFFINGHGGLGRFVPTEDAKDFYIKDSNGEFIEKHSSPISGKDFIREKWTAFKGFNEVDPNKDGAKRRGGDRKDGGVKHSFKDESDYRSKVDQANNDGNYKLAGEMMSSWSEQNRE